MHKSTALVAKLKLNKSSLSDKEMEKVEINAPKLTLLDKMKRFFNNAPKLDSDYISG